MIWNEYGGPREVFHAVLSKHRQRPHDPLLPLPKRHTAFIGMKSNPMFKSNDGGSASSISTTIYDDSEMNDVTRRHPCYFEREIHPVQTMASEPSVNAAGGSTTSEEEMVKWMNENNMGPDSTDDTLQHLLKMLTTSKRTSFSALNRLNLANLIIDIISQGVLAVDYITSTTEQIKENDHKAEKDYARMFDKRSRPLNEKAIVLKYKERKRKKKKEKFKRQLQQNIENQKAKEDNSVNGANGANENIGNGDLDVVMQTENLEKGEATSTSSSSSSSSTSDTSISQSGRKRRQSAKKKRRMDTPEKKTRERKKEVKTNNILTQEGEFSYDWDMFDDYVMGNNGLVPEEEAVTNNINKNIATLFKKISNITEMEAPSDFLLQQQQQHRQNLHQLQLQQQEQMRLAQQQLHLQRQKPKPKSKPVAKNDTCCTFCGLTRSRLSDQMEHIKWWRQKNTNASDASSSSSSFNECIECCPNSGKEHGHTGKHILFRAASTER